MSSLSVVVITKDQAWNVSRLISSVLEETRGEAEVIVVDSDSSDDTVALASGYPVRVLRLHSDQRLCPAAGRHVGFSESQGDFVLFLDGDMELRSGSLREMLAVLENDLTVACVTGSRRDLPRNADTPPEQGRPAEAEPEQREISHTGGAAMIRRTALVEVGDYNPYLYSDEEPELCLRLRAAGYRIVEIDVPFVNHYTDPPAAIPTLIRRARRRLYLGAGQAIRYHLNDGLLWPYIKERGFGLLPGVVLLLGLVVAVGSLLAGDNALWLGVLGAGFFLVGGVCWRKGSVSAGLSSLVLRLLILDGTLRGFLLRPYPVSSYPRRFDVIA